SEEERLTRPELSDIRLARASRTKMCAKLSPLSKTQRHVPVLPDYQRLQRRLSRFQRATYRSRPILPERVWHAQFPVSFARRPAQSRCAERQDENPDFARPHEK